MNSEPKDRLQEARKRAGFDSPTAAADHFGWNYSTYAGHENGSRGLKAGVAARYAEAFGTSPEWLLYGHLGPDGYDDALPDPGRHERAPGMVKVPVYDVEASAGHGALIHAEEQVDEMAFATGFVRSITASDPASLAIIRVKGDSMEPTMLDGDKVLVDRSKTSLDFDGIYVLRYGQALHVKRVGRHRRRGWVTITSDNDQYREIEAEYSDVDIVGRVLWFGRKV